MKKILLLLTTLIIISSFVSAECVIPYDGMIITEDTIFCSGEYELPNGISIGADNIVLDCNGAILNGIWPNRGVQLFQNNNVIIKNCNIQNYRVAISLHSSKNNTLIQNKVFNNKCSGIVFGGASSYNIISNNEISSNSRWCWGDVAGIRFTFYSSHNIISNNNISNNWCSGIYIDHSSHNTIYNNNFDSNYYGVEISGWSNLGGDNRLSLNNTVTKNNFKNNRDYAIFVYDLVLNNSVWDNDIYDTGIFDENESNNIYCINCVGNRYYDGAIGPTCPLSCCDEDNDEVPNDEDKCPNTIGEQIVYGCSCNQILELKPRKDKSSKCSPGIIKVFTKGIGWAKDLF
jgi:parallel beta-helix repeat protein